MTAAQPTADPRPAAERADHRDRCCSCRPSSASSRPSASSSSSPSRRIEFFLRGQPDRLLHRHDLVGVDQAAGLGGPRARVRARSSSPASRMVIAVPLGLLSRRPAGRLRLAPGAQRRQADPRDDRRHPDHRARLLRASTSSRPQLLIPLLGPENIGRLLGPVRRDRGRPARSRPLIASISEDAMRAVPRGMREGAYAMGATKFEVVRKVVFPAALSGIMASIILADEPGHRRDDGRPPGGRGQAAVHLRPDRERPDDDRVHRARSASARPPRARSSSSRCSRSAPRCSS